MPVTPSGTPFEHRATPGGGHEVVKVKAPKAPKLSAPKPTPVTIVAQPKSLRQRVTPGPSRLGTPAAFVMLAGLVLAYYALHGWDRKYGTFSGQFAGKGGAATGGGTMPHPAHTSAPKP